MFRSAPFRCQRGARHAREAAIGSAAFCANKAARIPILRFGPPMTAIPSNKLVTVFGGSGFLGRHIVRALANEGWRIRVAVRRPNLAHHLKPAGRVGQIQLLKVNVLDAGAVAGALKDAEAAIDLAGVLVQSGEVPHLGSRGSAGEGCRREGDITRWTDRAASRGAR